jgi:phospholipid/cholesterol/gamma-HCH transport system substrate-binding protein
MRSVSGVGRAAAMAAVIAAVVLVAVLLFGGGGSGYTVTADFLNAGQLVKGNPVQTGGVAIGSVKSIDITDEGQAVIEFSVDDDHSPLPVGTHATIRQFSQSGIANRYIDLSFPPQAQSKGQTIDDGGHLAADETTTAVDLDELFNTLDPKTRKALQGFFKGQAAQFHNMGKQANVGFEYLNPALSTSSRFFNELTRDTPVLERFLVDSSQLVTALAEKRDDLSSLISNLSTTTTALASQKTALADSISELPPFMRQANTTFVNLRSALDDVDPLVQASKPAVRQLGPFLNDARALVHDAEPTVRDLRITIDRNGKDNDLIDLLNSFPPLADLAVAEHDRTASPGGRAVDVGNTQGSLVESTEAFKKAAPEIAFGRPYTPDFFGWFDDFSTTGAGFDALGATARGHLVFSETLGGTSAGHFQRCPGAAEPALPDGSNVLSQEEQDALNCKESDRASD